MSRFPAYTKERKRHFIFYRYKELNISGNIQPTDLQALTETVRQLQEALQRKERNYEQLAKAIRWGVLGFVVAVVMTGFIISDRIGTAYAQSDAGLGQAQSVVQALNNINQNLAVFGMLGQSLKQAIPAFENAMMKNSDVQKHVQTYLKDQGVDLTENNMRKYATAAIVESAVTTAVHTVVLMQRIREDSNSFHEVVDGSSLALGAIQHELEVMNHALLSVPVMAAQMDMMNRNMASMSHSMGTTMGRVGSWVPW